MRKLLFILILAVTSATAQEIKTNDNGLVQFQKVFQVEEQTASEIYGKVKNHFKNNLYRSGSYISDIDKNRLVVSYEDRIKISFGLMVNTQDIHFRIAIDIQDNKYRVTVDNIVYIENYKKYRCEIILLKEAKGGRKKVQERYLNETFRVIDAMQHELKRYVNMEYAKDDW